MSLFKKIAIGLAVVALIGAGVAYYMFRQATALPEWYEAELAVEELRTADSEGEDIGWEPLEPDSEVEPDDEEIEPATPPVGGAAGPQGAAPAPAKPKTRRRKSAGPKVMRGFHRRSRRGKKKGKKTAVKASRATYHKGKLEAGVVLDLSRVPKDKLTEADKKLYDRAVRGFPGLTKRDVYVGVEDHPITRDGVLQLGSNPKVRVGNLRYSLPSAASKLGMSESQLRRDFNNELRRLGFTNPDG